MSRKEYGFFFLFPMLLFKAQTIMGNVMIHSLEYKLHTLNVELKKKSIIFTCIYFSHIVLRNYVNNISYPNELRAAKNYS